MERPDRQLTQSFLPGPGREINGDRLATAPLDRAAIEKLPIRGMGWRWY